MKARIRNRLVNIMFFEAVSNRLHEFHDAPQQVFILQNLPESSTTPLLLRIEVPLMLSLCLGVTDFLTQAFLVPIALLFDWIL